MQHAARDLLGFVDVDGVAEPREIIGAAQAGRPGADDRDALAGREDRRLLRDLQLVAQRVVADEALDRADRQRLVDRAAAAVPLAGMGADAAADRRERIVLPDEPVGVHIASGGDEGHVARHVDARGTGVAAGRGVEVRAHARVAVVRADMRLILVAEVSDGREYGVRGRLTETAHGGLLERFGELLEHFDVALLALALGDALQNLQHALRADAAGEALAAALVDDEVHEVARGVDHAGVLVHDDEAAGAHDRAERLQGFVVDVGVEVLLCETAAGRAAGLYGLEALAVRDAAADLEDDVAQHRPHRHLDDAGVDDVAREGEDLGALGFFGADGGVPVRALVDDRRDARERFDVVDDGRLFKEAGLEREGRLLPRLAAPALDGGEQRGLLAADERARANADLDVELKIRPEKRRAEQPRRARLFDGHAQTLDRERVLRADVDVALVRADGVAAEHHALDDGVGVALEDGAVHERAGIALVRVADHVLLVGDGLHTGLPLEARREARAAASAQTGLFHLADDLLPGHGRDCLADGGVAVAGDVGLERGVFHAPAVAQHDLDLLLEKRDVVDHRHALFLRGIVEGVLLDDLVADEVLFNDLRDLFGVHLRVKHAVRLDEQHGARRTGAHAAGDDHLHLARKSLCRDLADEGVPDLLTVGGHAARAAADEDLPPVVRLCGQIILFDLRKPGDVFDFAHASSPPSCV